MLAASSLAFSFPGAERAVARPFATGLFDGVYVTPDGPTRALWLDRTVDSRADFVRIRGTWADIAPAAPPPSFAPKDPADSGYKWAPVDAAVRDASARGLRTLLTLSAAPRWAEGPNRRGGAAPGSWRPDPAAFEAFARAAARRYSGTFPDPDDPRRPLPRVRYWQLWNEPNLSNYLSPQWVWRSGRAVPASPSHYRKLLNAGFRGIKAVAPDSFVVTAGTAPFGDHAPGGKRMAPALFLRELLCLRRDRRAKRCESRPRFDALAHHPYSVGGPERRAVNRDDVSVADIGKLSRILRVAVRKGLVRPRGRKSIWVTELSWDSSPPDPDGVPAKRHARWLSEALYRLWRAGVATVFWFQVRDADPTPSFAASFQSGLFTSRGTPKPAHTAFRFPFVVERRVKRKVRVWGRAPAPGAVLIQRRAGSEWRTVMRLRPGSSRVFLADLRGEREATFRAVVGHESSLAASVR